MTGPGARVLPTFLVSRAMEAQLAPRPSRAMNGLAWAVAALVAVLSIRTRRSISSAITSMAKATSSKARP